MELLKTVHVNAYTMLNSIYSQLNFILYNFSPISQLPHWDVQAASYVLYYALFPTRQYLIYESNIFNFN